MRIQLEKQPQDFELRRKTRDKFAKLSERYPTLGEMTDCAESDIHRLRQQLEPWLADEKLEGIQRWKNQMREDDLAVKYITKKDVEPVGEAAR